MVYIYQKNLYITWPSIWPVFLCHSMERNICEGTKQIKNSEIEEKCGGGGGGTNQTAIISQKLLHLKVV